AGNYAVYAILDKDVPQALAALADPTGTRAGFASLSGLLSGTNVVSAAGIRKDAGAFSMTITLPEETSAVLLARHRGRLGYEYRPITGAVTPWAIKGTGKDGSTIALPGDARYFVTDGAFGQMADRAATVMPL